MAPAPAPAPQISDADGGPLIGREADLERLALFVTSVSRVGGSLVVLGDPGVGKSALLAAIADEAEAEGLRVLRTTGVQYRAQAGYSALRQLLASAPSYGAQPVLAAALGIDRGAAPGPEAIAEAVMSLVADQSRGLPTLLVLDDAQWLDPASAVVLGQVARQLYGTGAGMICAARPGDESFFDHTGLPLHELGPLSEAASEALLVRCFPALAPQVRRRLMSDAEGNPLALLELPAALTDHQRSAAQALPAQLPLTRRLQATFASRITGLPAATRHLLLVAALEGTGNLQVLRRAVAGRCGMKHLAPAERVQLVDIDETTGRLGFRHPLTRAAVVDLATSGQRRSAHRALAEAWSGVPEHQAWHLARAAIGPSEPIAALLEDAAGLIARRGDGPNAVAALLRAADLSPAGTDRARRLSQAAYVGANLTGDLREVPRLLDTARRAVLDTESLAAAVAAAAYLLNGSGDVDTAHRLLSGAIALQPAPYDPDDAMLFEALHTLMLVCFFGGRPELWSAFDAALARYPAAPELLAVTRPAFADPARAGAADLAALDSAIDALATASDPVHIVRVAIGGAYVDRIGACDEGLRRVVAGGRRGENVAPAIDALFLLGNHAWHSGQWAELGQVAKEGLELCDQHHYPMLSWPGKFLLACAAAACGDFPTAREVADQMDQWAGSRRCRAVRYYAAHVRTLIALAQGDFDAAHRHAGTITPTGSFAPFAGHALWTILDQVEAAVRTGRREEAQAHVTAARELGLDEVSARLRMVVLTAAALAAEDDDEAFSWFGEALTVEDAERWPFDHARMQLYCGERLRRSKAPAHARDHLKTAADTFARLGARPWEARANKELRACGNPVRGDARREGIALTPQQWEIASHAAAGLTNKQIAEKLFLSPRTVSTHLYQVFPKLGITSRAALRDALEPFDRQNPC